MPSLRVVVPATSANLGPGFDCLGMALSLSNETLFTWTPAGEGPAPARVVVEGEGAGSLPQDASHMSVRALWHGLEALGVPQPGVSLEQRNRIPVARGLGSSSSAIVAGLVAARAIAGLPPDPAWTLFHAATLEGHADNVAAAIYGGITAAYECREEAPEGRVRSCRLPYPPGLRVALAVPDFQVSTEKARQALPHALPFDDVTFTLARAALLVGALATGDAAALAEATRDRVHTPYRSQLIPGFVEAEIAALSQGGAGVFISGSGPTVAAFVLEAGGVTADGVAQAMAAAFKAAGVEATPVGVSVSPVGAVAVPEPG